MLFEINRNQRRSYQLEHKRNYVNQKNFGMCPAAGFNNATSHANPEQNSTSDANPVQKVVNRL